MIYIIFIVIWSILNSFLSYYRYKLRRIIKSKGNIPFWNFKYRRIFKNIIKEEEDLTKKTEYVELYKKYNLSLKIVTVFAIAFALTALMISYIK